jgi:hypothetical protein
MTDTQTATATERRVRLLSAGYAPLPINGKRPPFEDWTKKTDITASEIKAWETGYPYARSDGLLTRRMPAFDIDIMHREASVAVEALVRERFGDRGCILVRIGLAPKRAIVFRTNKPFKKISTNFLAPDASTNQKLEFLCDGQQLVAFGIHKDTKKPYEWFGGEPGQVKLAELPLITEADAQSLFNDAVQLLAGYGYQRTAARPPRDDDGSGVADWSYLLTNIREGIELHDSIRDLAAKLIISGMGAGAATNLLRGVMQQSTAVGSERWQERDDDIPRAVDTAVERFGRNAAAPPKPITATPYAWRDPAKIRPRDFLYGKHLIRKFLSSKVAQGGLGKTTLATTEALAMISGKNLLGALPPRRLRVWLWNLEDPKEETERKIQAAAQHYGLAQGDIEPYLFVDSGRDQKLVIAETTRDGARIARPVVDSLIAQILARRIDVLIIDPFVSSHRVTENSNDDMDLVVKEWGAIAEFGNCAIELLHHSKKGELEKTVESSRGAIAITDACRSVQVLNRMTKDEAEKAGIKNHRLYFRVYGDKGNLAPPLETSNWFKLENVCLGNGPHFGGMGGDEVGVVTPWQWPDAMAGITDADFAKVAAAIKAGQWRENAQAKNWVGHAIAETLGLDTADKADRARIGGMLKAWLAAGALTVVEGFDEKRMAKKFVQVAEEV